MESQIAHPHRHGHCHSHSHEHEPHDVGLHQTVEGEEDEQHHEKKSVLKKVKAKAKKIKDTITKHGHGHDHDHADHHGHEYEEDDEEDEEAVEDPELQGSPLYEGAAMRSAVARKVENPSVGFGRSTAMHDYTPSAPRETTSRSVNTGLTSGKTPAIKEVDNSAVAPNTTMSLSPWSLKEDPHAPKDRTQAHAPRTSEVKVTDPAARGNEEAGASQILDSFAKMNVVHDEHETNPRRDGESDKTLNQTDLSTGSQFSPEPNPPKLDATIHEHQAGDQSSYAQKISAASSAVASKAISAKDFVASKLGYGETTGDIKQSSSSPLQYGKKIASTVTETLTETGNTVMSKIHGSGSGAESETAAKGQEDKGVSMKDYLAQKLQPSEEDRVLSEVISEAFHKRKEEVMNVGERTERQPKGKVTESEELTRRLGREDEHRRKENEERERSGDMNAAAATGRSVVDKLKDTVGSWLGKAGESPTSQQSIGSSKGVEGFMDSSPAGAARRRRQQQQQEPGGTEAEVRKLQESGN